MSISQVNQISQSSAVSMPADAAFSKVEAVKDALRFGISLRLSGAVVRQFRAGDVVQMQPGFFRIEQSDLFCRTGLIQDKGLCRPVWSRVDPKWMDDQIAAMTDADVARLVLRSAMHATQRSMCTRPARSVECQRAPASVEAASRSPLPHRDDGERLERAAERTNVVSLHRARRQS